jgi:6-phosphogluconolactonase
MATSTEVKIFASPKKVCKSVAREILKISGNSTQPRINIALSGGKTPEILFKWLAEKYRSSIPWARIHFWWGDERCVPPEDKNSNFRMTNELLFSKIEIPSENIHRIRGEEEPEQEASRYTTEIKNNLNHRNDIPVFDLVILGLGEDGHTASIFPGQPVFFEDKRICSVSKHPLTEQKRITITGNVINNANRIFFLVTGENKALRISEIMNNSEAAKLLPAYYIEPKHGSLIWFLDEAAAAKIS